MTITVGDKFHDGNGSEWKVIELVPGGKLELFNKSESRFCIRYHREVSNWARID